MTDEQRAWIKSKAPEITDDMLAAYESRQNAPQQNPFGDPRVNLQAHRWALEHKERAAVESVQGLARNVIAPVYKLAERIAAPIEVRPVGPIDNFITTAIGGPIQVPPGARATIGDVLQTAAMAAPGVIPELKAMSPLARARIGSAIGGAFGTGQALSENKGVLPTIGQGLVGSQIGAATSALSESPYQPTPEDIVGTRFTKAIRPTSVGQRTMPQVAAYQGRAVDAVKSIVENKPNLRLVDEYGDPTGKLPQSLYEFLQGIDQTKKTIFPQYNAIQKAAGAAGATVDLSPAISELKQVADDAAIKAAKPSIAQYAGKMAKRLENQKTFTPEQAQSFIAELNVGQKAFMKRPTYQDASQAGIDGRLLKIVRDKLDETITGATEPGYQALKNKWGALRAIEDDVAHRAMVDARKNQKGLLDFTDILSGADAMLSVARQDPSLLASGAAKWSISRLYKHLNDPNVGVKKMFQEVERSMSQQQPTP